MSTHSDRLDQYRDLLAKYASDRREASQADHSRLSEMPGSESKSSVAPNSLESKDPKDPNPKSSDTDSPKPSKAAETDDQNFLTAEFLQLFPIDRNVVTLFRVRGMIDEATLQLRCFQLQEDLKLKYLSAFRSPLIAGVYYIGVDATDLLDRSPKPDDTISLETGEWKCIPTHVKIARRLRAYGYSLEWNL